MPKKLIKGGSNLGAHAGPPSRDGLPLPKLIVFDLDYTLWPLWVDTHVTRPLKSNPSHTAALDRHGDEYGFYQDVPSVLARLSAAGIRLAIASRTTAANTAKEMMKILHVDVSAAGRATPPELTGVSDIIPTITDEDGGKTGGGGGTKSSDKFFETVQIKAVSKVWHFQQIQKQTGLPYEEMLFFDDEYRNKDTEALGVTMWLVKDGVNWAEIDRGIEEWRKRRALAEEPSTPA